MFKLPIKKLLALLLPLSLIILVSMILWKLTPEKSKNKYHGIRASSRGYWIGTGNKLAEYHHSHYGPKLSNRLLSFFKKEGATSVIDFGGGAGRHVQHLIKNGLFASCYDGSPESQDASQGVCATMDLTKPMQLAKYDWVLSLSVGRQIPLMLEDEFISNIHNLNSKGVVMFWGDGKPEKTPKNRKNNTQVIAIFEKLGYGCDKIAGKLLRGKSPTDVNYSLQVFRKVNDSRTPRRDDPNTSATQSDRDSGFMNIAVTSCGLEKMQEALTMVKSAIIFSQHTKLKVFVFVDPQTLDHFGDRMKELQQQSINMNPNFQYEILPIKFPADIDGMTSWESIFKPCSLQRLFLPTVLPSIEALIYLDADSIFLSNVTDFWNHFSSMTPENFIGVTEMTEFPKESWFQKNKVPHFGDRGVNTGISLMNLTRMRSNDFSRHITKVRKHYEHLRPNETGDQYLQNILYSFYPEFVHLIPCEWNLRPIHCRCEKAEKCACKSALENGPAVIHGTNNAFSDEDRIPFFKNIYQVFNAYNFTIDTVHSLLENVNGIFQVEKKPCFFKDSAAFSKRIETYVTSLQEH